MQALQKQVCTGLSLAPEGFFQSKNRKQKPCNIKKKKRLDKKIKDTYNKGTKHLPGVQEMPYRKLDVKAEKSHTENCSRCDEQIVNVTGSRIIGDYTSLTMSEGFSRGG